MRHSKFKDWAPAFTGMTVIEQILRTLFSAIVAFTFLDYLNASQGYWVVLTTLLLVQVRFNDSFGKNFLVVMFCGLLIALNVFFANAAAQNYYLLACYLLLTTFLSVYIGFYNILYFFSAFIINLLGAISGGSPVNHPDMITRTGCVLLGTVVAMIVMAIIWPPRSARLLVQQIAEDLDDLNDLQKQIFSLYLKRNYEAKSFLYEKKFHLKIQQIFSTMEKMRFLLGKVNKEKLESFKTIINDLDELFDIIISLGNLRYRVKDIALFEMCEKEFSLVSKNISNVFELLKLKICEEKNIHEECFNLSSYVQAIEQVYNGTLRVISKEPIVFLIFIQNLNALDNKLKSLSADIETL